MTDDKVQQYQVPVDNPSISHTVVLTTKDVTRDHEPLKDKDGKMLPGFFVCKQRTKPSDAFVKRLIKCRPPFEDTYEIKTLELWCAVKLRHNNMWIEIIVRLVKPESVPFSGKSSLTPLLFEMLTWRR